MKNKLGITEGIWEYCKSSIDPKKHNFSIVADFGTSLVADIYKKRIWNGETNTDTPEVSEANAKLIADAGTTANKCGKSPSQLLQENEEMKAMLLEVISILYKEDIKDYDVVCAIGGLISNNTQLLTKING